MATILKNRETWIRDRIIEITAALRSNAFEGISVNPDWQKELDWLTQELREIIEDKILLGVAIAGDQIQTGDAVKIGPDNRVHNLSKIRTVITPEMGEQMRSASDKLRSRYSVNKMQLQVREFMEKMDQVRGDTPEMRDHMLRFRLIWEESHELCDAILAEDFVKAIDGMCDLLYVVFGTAEAFGINLQHYFDEVHRTNMLKEKDVKDRWGKIVKPEGWQPPRIPQMLEEEMALAKDDDTRQANDVQTAHAGRTRKYSGPMD